MCLVTCLESSRRCFVSVVGIINAQRVTTSRGGGKSLNGGHFQNHGALKVSISLEHKYCNIGESVHKPKSVQHYEQLNNMYYEYEFNLISPILIPSGDAAPLLGGTQPWTQPTPEAPIQVDKVNKEHIEWVTMRWGLVELVLSLSSYLRISLHARIFAIPIWIKSQCCKSVNLLFCFAVIKTKSGTSSLLHRWYTATN